MSVLPYSPPAAPDRAPAEGQRFMRVIPLAFITYSLAYLDRVNYGQGAAGGLKSTLGLTDQKTALIAAIFFVGYCLLQIPGTAYAAHRSVRKLIFWALILWGVLSGATGVVTSFAGLIVIRFLLGVVEGVVYPSMLVYVSHWFTRREKSRANTLLILGNPITMVWGLIASGFLIEHFNLHPLALGAWHPKGWQWMFMLEGIPSIVWAFCWWFLSAEHPRDASWLTPAEAGEVHAVLEAEQRGLSPLKNYAAAFTDRRVVLLCVQFFFWSIAVYGFVFWGPTIIKKASGEDIATTGLLNAIPFVVASVAMLLVSYRSDRSLAREPWIWPSLLLAGLACLLVGVPGHFPIVFTGLILSGALMYAPYGPFWAVVPEIVPKRMVGESMALINTWGAAGGFVGSYVVGWLSGGNRGPGLAFAFMALCLATSAALTLTIAPARRAAAAAA